MKEFTEETKIIRYHVLWSDCHTDLKAHVNEYLKDGWKCQGGICFGKDLFFQAMTKEFTSREYHILYPMS